MEPHSPLIESLRQTRLAKLEQIVLLVAGHMRVTLHGIDVAGATLGEVREEVQMIEAVLREMGVPIEG